MCVYEGVYVLFNFFYVHVCTVKVLYNVYTVCTTYIVQYVCIYALCIRSVHKCGNVYILRAAPAR